MEFESFYDLKREMQTHKCKSKHFLSKDNLAGLTIGWQCKCGLLFELSMENLKKPQDMTQEEYSLLMSPYGRIKLGEILS